MYATLSAEMMEDGTNTYGFLQSEEAMAHPAPSCAVTADVSETFLMVSVGGTKGYFLNGLVNNKSLKNNKKRKY